MTAITMKRAILIGVNSRYSHTNLAIRYLEAMTHVEKTEYTINQDVDFIVQDLINKHKEWYCFSVYIWNAQIVCQVIKKLREQNKAIKILVGGPEVSFDFEEVFEIYEPDVILYGEGEIAFQKFVLSGYDYCEVPSCVYKKDGQLIINPCSEYIDMDELPDIYQDLEEYRTKALYYESSRGCPNRCSYCLSSVDKKVRFKSIEKTKKELKWIADHNILRVKFVDRTFNCNKKRAYELFEFLISLHTKTCFHCEIDASLIDEKMIELLKRAPKGRLQFEIGVQSTNEKTLQAVNRKTDLRNIFDSFQKLKSYQNIHLHLDLIAGLPYEDLTSFKKSFLDLYTLQPHDLQLGFLKLLRGCELRQKAKEYAIRYNDQAPFEFLETQWMNENDKEYLKTAEIALKKLYSSGGFLNSLKLLISCDDPLESFYQIGKRMKEGNKNRTDKVYIAGLLFEYGKKTEELKNALRMDLKGDKIPCFLKE